jgi:hypothetical protein
MNSLFRKKSIDKILSDAASGYGDVDHVPLHKVLGVKDLTFFGIAAIIGAGIFSSIGKACFDGGPGVIFTIMIMVALLTVICIVAGIYTGYHFGFEQKTKVYIVGAILFWAAGIDVIVRLVSAK